MLFAIAIASHAFGQETPDQSPGFMAIQGVNVVGREPLFLISRGESAKEASFEEVSKIDSRKIYSIYVLKDQDAIDQYGESARYGAIIITLKGNSFSESYPGKKTTGK